MFNVFGEERIKQFNIQAGEEITVQFDIDAREFNGRWYNDIRAYNILRGQVAQSIPAATTISSGAPAANAPFPQQPAAAAESPFPPAPETTSEGASDDLPF